LTTAEEEEEEGEEGEEETNRGRTERDTNGHDGNAAYQRSVHR